MFLKVFIASPSDVQAERRMVQRAVAALNPKLSRLYNCSLQAVDWNDFATLTSHGGGSRPQDKLNPWVRHSAIFVGLLHKRYGTPAHPPKKQSGTEEEFEIALANRDRIAILTYFRELRSSDAKTKQGKKVLALQSKLRKKGIVPKKYHERSDILSMVMADLLETVITNLPEWEHRDDIMEFFKLGKSLKQESPEVLIVYPPIHSHDPSGDQRSVDWHRRLVPNVVFEDTKAIQKVEAAIHKLGIRAVKSVTTVSPEAQEHDQNNVWLCLPRNLLARNRLRNYDKISRFNLELASDGQHFIKWRTGGRQGDEIIVRSPLSQYLAKRGNEAANAPWREEYGSIVARDFAVVSRFLFEGPWKDRAQRNHPFWEYFIFGIRGLGTWGAAWFVHNKASELAAIARAQKSKDVQVLLQITYSRHRIHEVVDVSAQTQQYFDDQNSADTIDHVVQDYRC